MTHPSPGAVDSSEWSRARQHTPMASCVTRRNAWQLARCRPSRPRDRSPSQHQHGCHYRRPGADRRRGSVRLPRAASTPFVLAALRALRVDPALARRCPKAADPDRKRLDQGVDSPQPVQECRYLHPRHPTRVGAVPRGRWTTAEASLPALLWRSGEPLVGSRLGEYSGLASGHETPTRWEAVAPGARASAPECSGDLRRGCP